MKKVEENVRSIGLPVDEVKHLITVFNDSRSMSHLNGRRRQDLDEAIAMLNELVANGVTGKVQVPITALRSILRAAAAAQAWLDWNFSEFDQTAD